MMNSMNKLINDLQADHDLQNYEIIDAQQLAIDIAAQELHQVLAYLKQRGFRQLSLLTCIDWPNDQVLQLVYIVMDWDLGIHIQVRCKLDRDHPKVTTITNIYPGAQYYERDVHEFFGVEFAGNPESFKPLFLELWQDIPPMRKDFDPQAYSDAHFPERTNKVKFESKITVQEGQ